MIEECQGCYSNWIEINRAAAKDYDCGGEIDYLIIAESPPCPHGEDIASYVYRIRGNGEILKHKGLLYAIMLSMEKAGLLKNIPEKKKDCLEQLSRNRIFVMDTCEYPVNQMPDFIREKAVSMNIDNLSMRLQKLSVINNIITTMERSKNDIRSAVKIAGLYGKIRDSLPFPRGRSNQEEFIKRLSDVFKNFPSKNNSGI